VETGNFVGVVGSGAYWYSANVWLINSSAYGELHRHPPSSSKDHFELKVVNVELSASPKPRWKPSRLNGADPAHTLIRIVQYSPQPCPPSRHATTPHGRFYAVEDFVVREPYCKLQIESDAYFETAVSLL
jgi:hypothetical protein